jgi:putative copper export protein/mono/diheme cytochrome c family protein
LGQLLFTTRFGALWIARLALSMILFWLMPQANTGRLRWAALTAGLLLLLTISLGSHAAAQPAPLIPVLADWVHLICASVWVGGLISFIVGLASTRNLDAIQRTRMTAELIPRFSALALISVGLLALTGLYASILHVGSFAALFDTIYGRTLLIKLILLLPMLLLGAINLLLTSPRMKQAVSNNGQGGQVSRFRRLVSSEVVLGVAVLLSVGVLTTMPPAQFASAAPKLADSREVDDLAISIEVMPGRPGLNTFDVKVGADSETVADIKEVSLQFTPVSGDLPPVKAELTEIGDGEYRIEGGFLALPDAWQIQVAVRRESAFDTFANFDFNVGSTQNPEVVQTFPWHQLSGFMLLISGTVGLLLSTGQVLQGKTESIYFGLGPGVVLVVAGIYVLVSSPGAQSVALVNPIPPNMESLVSGGELYQENCLPCHGVSGAGDGPIGRTLNPPPADLTLHTAPGVHPDGRLYDWITNGFPDSVMPAFKEHLTDEDRWHLVNYIRTLSQP